MNNRWYDHDPTLSMAVSLLQNCSLNHRERTTRYINTRIELLEPDALQHQPEIEKKGFWAVFQQRRKMKEADWMMIESFRFLTTETRKKLTLEMIHYIYLLESEDITDDLMELPVGAVSIAS